jgi:hypothetical protein
MHDVNSRGPHSTAPVSQATTRGSNADETREVPASSWLPFGAAEATDQPRWMSITLACPRPSVHAIPQGWSVVVRPIGLLIGRAAQPDLLVRQCGPCRLALHCSRRHPYDECIVVSAAYRLPWSAKRRVVLEW